MANDLEVAVRLELERRGYTRGLRDAGRQTQRFAGTSRRALQVLDRGFGRIANRWTALAGGFAGVQAVRGVARLDARMTRLGTNADISADQVEKLKQRIFEVSRDPDISIDPDRLLGGVEEVVGRVGDIEFALANLRNMAIQIQATGAEGSSIGAIMAELQKMNVRDPQEVAEAMGILVEQGKIGAVNFRDMGRVAPRVIQAYTSLGRTGVQSVREFGAAFQTAMRGTADVELAATAFERLLAELGNNQKLEKLRQAGIQVFDPDQLEQGRKVIRPITDLMREIVTRAGGDRTLIGQIFGDESIRAFNNVVTELRELGEIRSMDQFLNVEGDFDSLFRDAQRNAQTAEAAATNIATAFEHFANRNLTEPLKDFADLIASLDKETLDRWLTLAKWLGIGLTGIVAGRALFGAGRDVVSAGRFVFSGRRSGGVHGGGAGAAGMLGGAGPTPVWVVNMGALGGPVGQLSRSSSRMARAASILGRGIIGLPAAYAVGDQIGGAIDKWLQSFERGQELRMELAKAINDTLALFGNEEAQRIQAMKERQQLGERQQEALQGRLDIHVDAEGRVSVGDLQQSSRSPIQIEVDTGRVMPGTFG